MKKYNCISKDVKQLISKSHSAHNDLYKFIDQLDFNSKENELKFHTEVEKNQNYW